MRIWVDIANAPHVAFFRPLVDRFRNRGHEVFLTAQDRGQTLPLALATWPEITVVGAGFAKGIARKSVAVLERADTLRRMVRTRSVDVAIGHNSYPQIVAARLARVPSVTVMDYEHQPANHLAFRLASRVVVPSAIPDGALRRLGARGRRVVRYEGVKEEIALADFRPDPEFRERHGIASDRPLVTLRPAPSGALYHRHGNELFDVVTRAAAGSDATVLLTPRTARQASEYDGVPGIRVLHAVVPGADLLFHSDLFVGAGGTMTREAAVLGTPAISIFSGRTPAVDLALERAGKLRIVRDAAELDAVARPVRLEARTWKPDPDAVDAFAELLLGAARAAAQDG
jgi:predicted glycosyltransferase